MISSLFGKLLLAGRPSQDADASHTSDPRVPLLGSDRACVTRHSRRWTLAKAEPRTAAIPAAPRRRKPSPAGSVSSGCASNIAGPGPDSSPPPSPALPPACPDRLTATPTDRPQEQPLLQQAETRQSCSRNHTTKIDTADSEISSPPHE